jgi:hypothetical protein
VGFSKTAWDTKVYPAKGLSPGLSPFGFGFVMLGVEPRVLHIIGTFYFFTLRFLLFLAISSQPSMQGQLPHVPLHFSCLEKLRYQKLY